MKRNLILLLTSLILLFALSIILLIGCSQKSQNSMDAEIKNLIIKHRGTQRIYDYR